ncbi:MAG: Na+/H+ antiporter subunit E [Myxococcota bacterium]
MRLVNLILLTVVWGLLFSTWDWRALAFGALVSWGLLAFSDALQREPGAPTQTVWPRPVGLLVLALAFLRELILSAWSVVREAWRPTLAIHPGIVAIPLDVESDLEITVLASLISLTPGTLSLEVTPDGKTLYVHALVVDGEGADIRESIYERLEKPVKSAFRVT